MLVRELTVPLSPWIIWLLAVAWAMPVCAQPESWKVLVPGEVLGSDQILSLAVDKNGVTWIGTDQGVARSEMEELSGSWRDGMAGRAVWAIAVDQENLKWFATEDGVFSFDGKDWTRYGEAHGLISREVRSIAVDHQNVKWFGTKYGLSRFDGRSWTSFTKEIGLPDIIQVAVGPEGDVWLATSLGLAHYDGVDWQRHFPWDGPGRRPRSIAIDQHGVVWCGTNDGLSAFDGRFWHSFEAHETGIWLPGITSVFVDPANDIWIAANQPEDFSGYDTAIIHYDRERFTEYRFSNWTFANSPFTQVAGR